MKHISTLVIDMYQTINKKDGWFDPELSKSFSEDVGKRMSLHLNRAESRPTLRLSQMGPKCPCALWHSIHHPELAEPLSPQAMIKYSYGHVLEAFAIMLAKAAGHEVTGEQDELVVDGIVGHRDCVIDGCLLDVKSASSPSFQKFKDGTLGQSDSFGYLDQLDGYVCGSLEDPLVRVKDKAYLLAIDKTLGHMVLYEHTFREQNIRSRIASYKAIVDRSTPPKCECGTRPSGESGNIELAFPATYSAYKWVCFPNLRCFVYAGEKPKYLTRVVKRPKDHVIEIDKFGRRIG